MKSDFPLLTEKRVVYLDSAATSQRPMQVIDAIKEFYAEDNASIHRGLYDLSVYATEKYEQTRKKVAQFINAENNEIIFTKGATESINFLTQTLHSVILEGKNEIILSEMEHHSNMVPWQQLAKEKGFVIKYIREKNGILDSNHAKELINEKTAIVSVVHVSNSLGTVNNVKEICTIAREKKALSVIDAAQSVGRIPVDVKEIGCDFLAFSGHKMYGPFGVGVLFGRSELLKELSPYQFGGDMIETVSYEGSTWNKIPERFEAGTQNVAGVIGLREAIDFITEMGIPKIQLHDRKLMDYALEKLREIDALIFGRPSVGIISFILEGIHPHDIASLLNDDDIAIRAGHHCCMPLMNKLGISGTCRISFGVYTEKEDIDTVIESLRKIKEKFKNGK